MNHYSFTNPVDNVKSRVRKSKFLQLEIQKSTFQKPNFHNSKIKNLQFEKQNLEFKNRIYISKNEIYISKIKIYISINGWPHYASVALRHPAGNTALWLAIRPSCTARPLSGLASGLCAGVTTRSCMTDGVMVYARMSIAKYAHCAYTVP